jgi:hypothetical protein
MIGILGTYTYPNTMTPHAGALGSLVFLPITIDNSSGDGVNFNRLQFNESSRLFPHGTLLRLYPVK